MYFSVSDGYKLDSIGRICMTENASYTTISICFHWSDGGKAIREMSVSFMTRKMTLWHHFHSIVRRMYIKLWSVCVLSWVIPVTVVLNLIFPRTCCRSYCHTWCICYVVHCFHGLQTKSAGYLYFNFLILGIKILVHKCMAQSVRNCK